MRAPIRQFVAYGFSMVELLVAMAISLIGMIIIFQVFEVSEGIKRTTTSGGDAQQNGAIALFTLEHELRNAGMGIYSTQDPPCNIVGFDSGAIIPRVNPDATKPWPWPNGLMPMVPVSIVASANPQIPDKLSVFYGSQPLIASPTTLKSPMLPAGSLTGPLYVNIRFAFRTGDLILLQQGTSCDLREVTALPGTDEIDHTTNSYSAIYTTLTSSGTQAQASKTPTPRFNAPVGTSVSYVTTASVFNLGNLHDTNPLIMPVYNTYEIGGNALKVTSAFLPSPPTTVADNIVHMRAQYGVGAIFLDAAAFNALVPVPWGGVTSVRIAVVARSASPEKPTSGFTSDACDTTVAPPPLPWGGGRSMCRRRETRIRPRNCTGPATATACSRPPFPCATQSGNRTDMNPNRCNAQMPHRQRGTMLIIALIILVAMTLAGIAMMRSVDTATVMAGNIAFRQASVNAVDAGIQAAYRFIDANKGTAVLNTTNTATGFVAFAVSPDPDWNSASAWGGAALVNGGTADRAGNVIYYKIERLCPATREGLVADANCASTQGSSSTGGVVAEGSDQSAPNYFTQLAATHFRVTVRAVGPRNSAAIVQTMMSSR